MLLLSVFTGILALTVIYTLGWAEHYLIHSKQKNNLIAVKCKEQKGVLAEISQVIANEGFNIENVTLHRSSDSAESLEIKFSLTGKGNMQALLIRMGELACIYEVQAH